MSPLPIPVYQAITTSHSTFYTVGISVDRASRTDSSYPHKHTHTHTHMRLVFQSLLYNRTPDQPWKIKISIFMLYFPSVNLPVKGLLL